MPQIFDVTANENARYRYRYRYRYFIDQKAWAPQGINDIYVQMAQMSVYKITYY